VLVKNINFVILLTDIYDDNIGMFGKLEDGSEYTIIMGTPKNHLRLMNKN
jgi:hypothetical protein